MKAGSRKIKSLKQRIKSRMASRSMARSRSMAGGRSRRRSMAGGRSRRKSMSGSRSRRRSMAGGYSQYQNNQPFSLSYSVGGVIPASQLALANPPPITVRNDAVDNYNHYTNMGFPSRGH